MNIKMIIALAGLALMISCMRKKNVFERQFDGLFKYAKLTQTQKTEKDKAKAVILELLREYYVQVTSINTALYAEIKKENANNSVIKELLKRKEAANRLYSFRMLAVLLQLKKTLTLKQQAGIFSRTDRIFRNMEKNAGVEPAGQ